MPLGGTLDQLSAGLRLSICFFQFTDRLLVRSCEDYLVESAMMWYAWLTSNFANLALVSLV